MKTDAQLVVEVLQGNHQLFAVLVAKYERYVFSIVGRLVVNREDAQEAAQDVFVKAFKMLASYKGQSKFSTWLYRIAYHTAIDYSRRKRPATESIDQPNAPYHHLADTASKVPHDLLHSDQCRLFIDQALARLPETDRLVLTLFYLQEHSVAEIANLLGWTVANVKVKLFRLRTQLKFDLENLLSKEARELI